MKIEDILGKAVAYKFRTKHEVNEFAMDIVEKALIGFGYLVRPIAEPLVRILDRAHDFYDSLNSDKF